MNIQTIQHGAFFYALIDEFYSDEALPKVMAEAERLKEMANNDPNTGASLNSTGEKRNTGKGVWLDHVFSQNRNESAILTYSTKLFDSEIADYLASSNIFYKHISKCTTDWTLLNIYENKKEYKDHTDESMLTAICFLKFGDFVGGDLVFPEANIKVKFKHNRMVIFPGCMRHAAEESLSCNGGYRVSIAKFLNYKCN